MRIRLRAVPFCITLAALSAGTNLAAQGLQPGFSLTPVFDATRSHAPLQLDAKLSWDSVDLLVGRLELEFYVNQRLAHTWVSNEVVLSAGDVTLPVIVPPIMLPLERDLLSAQARFVTDQTVHDLEIHDVLYPLDSKRVLTVGIVHPENAGMPPADFTTPFQDRFAWVEPFRLDAALPSSDWARHLACRTTRFDPELLPDNPLELMAFDLLIVTNEGLADLENGQLDALAGWVEAGGATCVAGEWARSETQQSFLRRLTGSSPANPIFEFDADGNLRLLLTDNPGWLTVAPGVGRAIVTFRPVDVQTPQWKHDVLELWRVRPGQIEHILETGAWEFPVENDYMLRDPFFWPLRPRTASEPAELQSLLMPDRVEGVPLYIVAMLLAACLLAVAPGDYLLLGWLNRRRWTWVLFPAIAIGFSFFMVRLAQSHMGQADHRTTLTVVDLKQDGVPARVSRFELIFAASEKRLQDELANTFVVPLDRRWQLGDDTISYSRVPSEPSSPLPAAPEVTTGRVPRHYTHHRSLRQWTPRLARYTRLGTEEDIRVPEFDWSKLDPATLQNPVRRHDVLNEFQARMPDARILQLNQTQIWEFDPDDAARGTDANQAADSAEAAESAHIIDDRLVRTAEWISARDNSGLFQIVSQISPNAGGNLEDLALLDRNDPRQWLLLIVTVDDEGNCTIFRRLIRESDA